MCITGDGASPTGAGGDRPGRAGVPDSRAGSWGARRARRALAPSAPPAYLPARHCLCYQKKTEERQEVSTIDLQIPFN